MEDEEAGPQAQVQPDILTASMDELEKKDAMLSFMKIIEEKQAEARLEVVRRVRKANIGVIESGFKTTLYSLSPDIDLELDAIERENQPKSQQ